MDENKFAELIKNDDFIGSLLGCSSREEMKKVFETHNQPVSEEELDYFVETIEKALQMANSICADESMETVAGGNSIGGETIEAAQEFDPIEDAILRKAVFNAHQQPFKPV